VRQRPYGFRTVDAYKQAKRRLLIALALGLLVLLVASLFLRVIHEVGAWL
jgi:hypothetical protein